MTKFFLTIVTLPFLGATSLTAQVVLPGYELFSTQPTASYDGTTFVGDPLSSYNFGGTTGLQNVNGADIVLQRLQTATTATPTINIQLDAVQLETAAPATFGGGPVGNYFVTLQSADGTGPASTGQMTLTFGAQPTFTTSLDVFYDIHYGSLTGQIVQKGDLEISNSSATWGNAAPIDATLINGINNDLNGTNNSGDFWTTSLQAQSSCFDGTQIIGPTLAAPEPKSWALAGIAGLFMSVLLLRRQRQSA